MRGCEGKGGEGRREEVGKAKIMVVKAGSASNGLMC